MEKASFLSEPVIVKGFEIAKMAGGEGRLVGGVVRDWLIGRPLGDYDMAVNVPITDFADTARAKGYRIIETGLAHGSVTLHYKGVNLEVTQTRSDIETDGRHAVIGFTPSFEEDAKRRDFTINALYLDADGTLHDPLNGRADLAAKKIAFIGGAAARMQEDYLRILRYFRFAAQLPGFVLEEATLAIIAAHLDGLRHVSGERILVEFQKFFGGENWSHNLPLLSMTGIDSALFGGAFYPLHPLHARFDSWQCAAASCLTPAAKTGFLQLPLSRQDKALIGRLLTPFEAGEIEALQTDSWREAVHFGGDDFYQRCLIQQHHQGLGLSEGRLSEIENFTPPPCPVTGHHLQQAGVPAGPEIGALLRLAELAYIRSDYQRDADDIIAELMRTKYDETDK